MENMNNMNDLIREVLNDEKMADDFTDLFKPDASMDMLDKLQKKCADRVWGQIKIVSDTIALILFHEHLEDFVNMDTRKIPEEEFERLREVLMLLVACKKLSKV